MRILQSYSYFVGAKIPFDKWPGIIEEFLQQQKLTHRFFHYYLANYDFSQRHQAVLDGTACKKCNAPAYVCDNCRKQAASHIRRGTACERAVKENPFLGKLHIQETEYDTVQSLHNLTAESNGSKDSIYAIMTKIYRRYGFSNTCLIYRDIDFFSQRVPTPAPDESCCRQGYQGSGIRLYRSCVSNDSLISMVVESVYPGQVPDATPYADALEKLLPGITRFSSTDVIMDAEEQAQYEKLHQQAGPLVKKAKDFFLEHMPEEKGNFEPDAPVKVATWLKKMGKRYGYTYCGYHYYVYFMEKKLPNGHYICLEFVSNPSCPDADPYVSLCGLGFHHRIWVDGFGPQNPKDASDYFTKLFEVLTQAEQTVFADILNLYPPSPDWFIPSH